MSMDIRDRYLAKKLYAQECYSSVGTGKRKRTDKELLELLRRSRNRDGVKRINLFLKLLKDIEIDNTRIDLIMSMAEAVFPENSDCIKFVALEYQVQMMPIEKVEALMLGESL